jgi:hypothetical protein
MATSGPGISPMLLEPSDCQLGDKGRSLGSSSAIQVDEFDVYKCKLRATHPCASLSQDLESRVDTLKGIVVLYVYMRRWSMVRNDGAWLVLSGLYKEEHACEALSKQRSLTRRSIKCD